MKFLLVIISLCFLLVLGIELFSLFSSTTAGSSLSTSTNDTLVSNITGGSSFSSNDAIPYWLSPSGNIAFGFYQLPCTRSSCNCSERYVVGTWFVKSPQRTLVWTANRTDLLLHKPSSIIFTDQGKLVLRIIPDNKDYLLLPDVPEPAAYAKIHDDGNFVMYGSESQVVWESFDHPTDTILGGQKLKAGVNLISGNYMLSVRQKDGLVAIYNMDSLHRGYRTEEILKVVLDDIAGSVSSPLTLNLDTTGNLYLVDSHDVVLKYLYRNKNQEEEERSIMEEEEEVHIYRATLDSGGNFNLYKERIDGNISSTEDHNEKSPCILVLLWQAADEVNHEFEIFFILLGIITLIGLFCLL